MGYGCATISVPDRDEQLIAFQCCDSDCCDCYHHRAGRLAAPASSIRRAGLLLRIRGVVWLNDASRWGGTEAR
jgi:hypothetical protein